MPGSRAAGLVSPRLALALLAGSPAGCSRGPASAAAPELRVHRGEFRNHLLLTGEIRAVRTEGITVPRLPGWQTTLRWMAPDGSTVKAGDKLVELDASSFTSNLQELRLGLSRAENDLARNASDLEARLADKEAEVERKKTAFEKAAADAAVPDGLLPLRDEQERQLALERARIALGKADNDLRAQQEGAAAEREVKRIAVAKARRALDAAEHAAEAAVLRAPEDGVVLFGQHPWEGRKLEVGDMAWVGMTVATIPDLSAMEIEAWLSDVDDGRVVAGQPATAALDAWPELSFSGRVSEVSPIALEPAKQSLRRSFRVRIALDAVDVEHMRPGMSVRAAVETAARSGVLLAARGGLDLTGKTARARLATGGSAEVKLGPCNALECVIETGVAEGTLLADAGKSAAGAPALALAGVLEHGR